MRKGLLMSAAGLLLAGSGTAYGACTPVLDCASLGYKYSSSECSGSGVACPFDTSKYFCAEPCTYTVTKATCDSQCKNVGDKACTKNGTVYYESCGSSKCGTGYKCTNGSCTSTCNYSYTAASCSSQCKSVGSTSCVKDGTTYYSSCGSSLCSSGQTCNNGNCVANVNTTGSCCGYTYSCGYSGGTSNSNDSSCQDGWGMSCYNKCKSYNYPNCNTAQANCRNLGRTFEITGCSNNGQGTAMGQHTVYFTCQ